MPEHSVVGVVIAVVGLLLVAALAAIGLRRVRLPYTVGLVLVGLVLGALARRIEALQPLTRIELSPDIILFVFLPTLIFESAFTLDVRLLSRNLAPVLALAAPGLLLSTAIVGGLVALLTPLDLGPALVFGALISATDPVAVVALFRELGVPRRLAVLVEGESLFNDATAIVLFQILVAVLAGGSLVASTVGQGAIDFAVVFLGGLAVGAAIGYLMVRSIALAKNDPLVEVALSTVVAYAAFITADHYLHLSGVMATVGAGVVVGTLGSTRFSPAIRAYLHQFWLFAAFVANSLIFLLVGLHVTLAGLLADWRPILWAILAVTLARAATVFGLVPIVSRLPGAEPIDRRHQTVLVWGGLRGAVALALVLSLPPGAVGRELMTAMTVGVVLWSLLASGLTMGWLLRALGLDTPPLVERVARAQARAAAKRQALDRVQRLRTSGHYSARVVDDVVLEYQGAADQVDRELAALRAECETVEVRQALWSEALRVERTAHRELYERGGMSESVLHELVLGLDLQHDALRKGRAPDPAPEIVPLEVRALGALVGLVERVRPASRLVQRHRLRLLAARYEHDSAVLEAGRRVVAEVVRLAALTGAAGVVEGEVRAFYEVRGEEAMRRLDAMAEHFPEYVGAVQAQAARRIGLDAEADAIELLATGGGIPSAVAREARQSVEMAQYALFSRPIHALEPKPQELLGRVPMFQALGPEDLRRVAARVVPRTVLAGETVVRQGDRDMSLFLVGRGVVAVLISRDGGPPERVASLHAGDFFGEMALLTEQARSATVRAVTDSQLYELAKLDVDALCQTCPGVEQALREAHRERQERSARYLLDSLH